MKLLAAFVLYGPDLPSADYVSTISVPRPKLLELIQQVRDLLYCMHDACYFEDEDGRNETLTSSMIVAWPKTEPSPVT